MVNKEAWDSDERNNQNDLAEFLRRWSRHEQTLLKGIKSNKVAFYLSLEEQDFRRQLEDSLTLAELEKLSREEKRFRDKLIENTMSVWRRHKEEIKEGKKEVEQEIDYYQQKHDERWTPLHHEPQPVDHDHDKIYSVSEASRLHEGKRVRVIGSISGVQPLRKMVKGIQVRCLKCNTVYERKYSKPAFFESASTSDRIHKCIQCKTGKFLQDPTREIINAVVVELKDSDTFSEIDPLRIIVFGDDEPAYDNTRGIEKHVGETVIVTGDIYPVDISKRKHESRIVSYLYVTHLVNYLSKQDVELTAEDVKAVKRFVKHVGEDNIVDKLTLETGIELEESNITISHLSDTSDASDMVLETCAKNESEKNISLQKKIFQTFAASSKRASDTSDTSDSSSNVIEESSTYHGQISFAVHKVSEHATKLGKYGTWKCNHCEYKDDVVSIISHLRRGHNITVVASGETIVND